MDALQQFLDDIQHHAKGNFLGLLYLLIGRRIARSDGTLVSSGLTWRELAALLKKVRWDTEFVRELGRNPDELAPRDRQRFWYTAIVRAEVDSPKAAHAGEQLAQLLAKQGYVISPPPGA